MADSKVLFAIASIVAILYILNFIFFSICILGTAISNRLSMIKESKKKQKQEVKEQESEEQENEEQKNKKN